MYISVPPRMQISKSFISSFKSSPHLFSTSSTAAEEIETPPRAIAVSVRTRFPADTAVLSIRVSTCHKFPRKKKKKSAPHTNSQRGQASSICTNKVTILLTK